MRRGSGETASESPDRLVSHRRSRHLADVVRQDDESGHPIQQVAERQAGQRNAEDGEGPPQGGVEATSGATLRGERHGAPRALSPTRRSVAGRSGLPHGRVLSREPVGSRRPPPPARAARDAPVAQALQGPRSRRAGVRTLEARVGARPSPRPWSGSGRASRRPDDPRQAGVCAQSSASRSARGISYPRTLRRGWTFSSPQG